MLRFSRSYRNPVLVLPIVLVGALSVHGMGPDRLNAELSPWQSPAVEGELPRSEADVASSAVHMTVDGYPNTEVVPQVTPREVALETAALDAVAEDDQSSSESVRRSRRRKRRKETVTRQKETREMKSLMESGDLDGVKRILDGTLKRGFSGVGGLNRAARRYARLTELKRKLSIFVENKDYMNAHRVQRQIRLLDQSNPNPLPLNPPPTPPPSPPPTTPPTQPPSFPLTAPPGIQTEPGMEEVEITGEGERREEDRDGGERGQESFGSSSAGNNTFSFNWTDSLQTHPLPSLQTHLLNPPLPSDDTLATPNPGVLHHPPSHQVVHSPLSHQRLSQQDSTGDGGLHKSMEAIKDLIAKSRTNPSDSLSSFLISSSHPNHPLPPVPSHDHESLGEWVNRSQLSPSLFSLLSDLGMARYYPGFAKNLVDSESLLLLTEAELRELCPHAGPRARLRKKIEEQKRSSSDKVKLRDAQEKAGFEDLAWECRVCTVSNEADTVDCQVCGSRRPRAFFGGGRRGMDRMREVLESEGLGQYVKIFQDEAVDMNAFSKLQTSDLERLVPLVGHRARMRHILRAPERGGESYRAALEVLMSGKDGAGTEAQATTLASIRDRHKLTQSAHSQLFSLLSLIFVDRVKERGGRKGESELRGQMKK
ncbi:hypothetical protein AAMO2058_001012600 [Amorphochlora amoebiformis]